MKKSPRFNRNRLSQAIALACLSAVTAPVMAGTGSCPTAGANVISNAQTTECGLNTGDSVEITSSGSITSTAEGVDANGNSTGAINNAGIINAVSSGIYLYSSGSGTVTGNVTNSGTIISTQENGIFLYGTVDGNINNTGLIDAKGRGIYLYGGGGQATVTGNIINSGTITTTDEAAIYIYGEISGNIENSGLIKGGSTAGIYVDDPGTIVGDIINSGTIEATTDNAITLNGGTVFGNIKNSGLIQGQTNGIYVYNNSTVSGDIINSGTIVGTQNYGIYIYVGSEVGGNINNSGLIKGDDMGIYIYLSTVVGNVVNSGLIQGASQGIYVYNSTIGGNVVNSGTIEATNDDGISFLTSNSGGTLIGTLINSGTLLGGLEMFDGDVSNSGLINTKDFASTVADNYTQTAAGIFQINADSAATFGKLTAGTATFAAGSVISIDAQTGNTLVAGNTLNDVVSATTLNASTFSVLDNLLPLSFTAAIDGNTVDITAAATGLTTVAAATLAGGYSQGVGAAIVIDTLFVADPTGVAAFAFGGLSTEQEIANGVESVVPVLSGGLAQASQVIGSAVTDVVGSRQDAETGISSGDGYLVDGHMWLKPFGGFTDQDKRDGVSGYGIDSYGIAVGLDGAIPSSSWSVGAAFAWIKSDVDSDITVGSQNVDVHTYLGKIYASYKLDDVTSINLQGGVGKSNYDSKRVNFTGAVARADYDSTHYQASAELVRSYQINTKTSVSPYIHVDYIKVDVDDYVETGAGSFNLTVGDDANDSLVLGGGVKSSYAASDKFLLTGKVGVGYDALADSSSLTSSFAGGGAKFSTQGIKPDEIVYNVGVGGKYSVNNVTEVTAHYNLRGRDDYTDQSIGLNVRWSF